MRGEEERGLGEKQDQERDEVEGAFGDEREEYGQEEAADEFGEPVEESNGRGGSGGVVPDGEAGEPASEGVLVADVEEQRGGEDGDGDVGERDAGGMGCCLRDVRGGMRDC